MFHDEAGILVPARSPIHRGEDYDEANFDLLLRMQREHFWYRGRHRLILKVLRMELAKRPGFAGDLRAIDFGGGCGGWLEYLHTRQGDSFETLALGDSSLRALSLSGSVVGSYAKRYHVDLLDLPWSEDWDIVFLLDVLEHVEAHGRVLRQIRKSLRPGGLLFVTVPALTRLWTYNDVMAKHYRRYSRTDVEELFLGCGFRLCRADYFMFFLSAALYMSRALVRISRFATPEQVRKHLARTHRVPMKPLNMALEAILALESALIDEVRFPWGTSVLAVCERPAKAGAGLGAGP